MRKDVRKAALAAALAVTVGVGGLVAMPTTAEAGFGGIGKIAGDAVGIGDSGGKVDIEGLTKRQNQLLTNLVYSTALLQMSAGDMDAALGLGLGLQGHTANQNAAVKSVVSGGDAGKMLKFSQDMNNSFGDKKAQEDTQQKIQSKLKETMSSGDKAKLEQLDGVIRQAKAERTVSDTLVAAAAIDAVKIIKDANSVIKGGGDVVAQAKQILDTTKAAQTLLKQRSAVSKMLKTATKEYEKTRKVEISSDDKKKAEQSVGKE